MKRSIRAILDLWIARIGTVFGWVWFVFWAMITVVAFCEILDAKESLDYAMPFVCLGLTAVHFLIIRVSKRTRELVGDFRHYSQLLAGDKSIPTLCRATGEPEETVRQRLNLMCKRGYFRGRIDAGTDRLVLDDVHEAYASRCPGCGATTKIYRNGDRCRYCGNPLMVAGPAEPDGTAEAPEETRGKES